MRPFRSLFPFKLTTIISAIRRTFGFGSLSSGLMLNDFLLVLDDAQLVLADEFMTLRQKKQLGGNAGFPDYYFETPFFANVVHQAGPFRAFGQSDVGATLNANQWPTGDFSQTLMTFLGTAHDSYNGVYKGKARFTGLPSVAPTITYSGFGGGTTVVNSNIDYNPATGVMTWDATVTALANNFAISFANTGGPIDVWNFYRPGISTTSPPVFTPFQNRLHAEFTGGLRWMDGDQANVCYLMSDWATQRHTLTNWHQGSDRYQFGQTSFGIPNELTVAAYEEAGIDFMWRCAPLGLNSFTAWATTMVSSLPVGKKMAGELGNEIWLDGPNSAFNYRAALVETKAFRLAWNNATFSSNEIATWPGITQYFSGIGDITSITSDGTTATVTFNRPHLLASGNVVTRGLAAGWNVGSVGSRAGAAVTTVPFTVTDGTHVTWPCTQTGTMSMDPINSAGVYFNPASKLIVGIDGIYELSRQRHASRTRDMGIALKAAAAAAGRTADVKTVLMWRSGATDDMVYMHEFMDYLDTQDGLGGSEVIDVYGDAIYFDTSLNRIAGMDLVDQKEIAVTPTEILDAIEMQVDYAERAYSLSNMVAMYRDLGKEVWIYEAGIDTAPAYGAHSGTNHANVDTANQSARVKTITKKGIDAHFKAGVDKLFYYSLRVGPYAGVGCFALGNNVTEVDPLTGVGGWSNRMTANQEMLDAARAEHTRHLLSTTGGLTVIDGRDRINFTQWTGASPFLTLAQEGSYYDHLKNTHKGYEITAPETADYKLQVRAILTTTGTDNLQFRVKGVNVASAALANRGSSNAVEESLATVTLSLEKGANYVYIGGLATQSPSTVIIKSLNLVAVDYALPVGITGSLATTANVDQAYVGGTVTRYNGTGPFNFSLVGPWPDGTTITPVGGDSATVGGTITETGTFAGCIVRVTDTATGQSANLPAISLSVVAGDALVALDTFEAFADGAVIRNQTGFASYPTAFSGGVRDQFTAQSGAARWPNNTSDQWSFPGDIFVGRNLGTDQQAVEFQLSVTPDNDCTFWFCAAANVQDGLVIKMPSQGNNLELFKVVGGTQTSLHVFTGIDLSSGDVLMLRRYGTNCAVYMNNSLLATNIAIGTFTGGNYAGAGSYLMNGGYQYIGWYGPITQLLKP